MNTTKRLNALAAQLLSAREAADILHLNHALGAVHTEGRSDTATARAILEQAQLVARCTERRLYAYRAGQQAARNGSYDKGSPFSNPELANLFWDGAEDEMSAPR